MPRRLRNIVVAPVVIFVRVPLLLLFLVVARLGELVDEWFSYFADIVDEKLPAFKLKPREN